GAGHQVRVGDQHEDREGPRPDHPALGAGAGGRVDRVTPHALAQRRHVLFTMLTTLGYQYPAGREPAVIAGIRQYLSGWPGTGGVIAGMARQQYDLQLRRFGQDGWSATFYPAGIAHSLTPMVGSGLGTGAVDGGAAGGVGGIPAGGGL